MSDSGPSVNFLNRFCAAETDGGIFYGGVDNVPERNLCHFFIAGPSSPFDDAQGFGFWLLAGR